MVETFFFFFLNVRKCRNLRIYILEVRLVSQDNTCGALFSARFGSVFYLHMFYTICAPGRNGSVQKVAPNSAFRQVGAVIPDAIPLVS